MKNLKSRAAVILLITTMCLSVLFSANIFQILPVHAVFVVDTIPVGTGPYGVAYDSVTGMMFVTNDIEGSVSVIDTATRTVVATIPVGANPESVACGPTFLGEIYVANYGSGSISVISHTSLTVTRTIDVGGNPSSVAYDSGNGLIYVSDWSSSSVKVINYSTVVQTIDVGINPSAVVYDGGKGEIFVANQISNTTSIINDATNTVVDTVTVGTAPDGLAYDAAKSEIFVANWGSNTVTVIDDNTNKLVVTVPVGAYPRALAYDSGRGWIYVANWNSGTVSVIDDTTYNVVATVPVGAVPAGVAYDSFRYGIFVTNSGSNTVSVLSDASPFIILDPTSGTVGSVVSVEGSGFPAFSPIPIMLDSTMLTTITSNATGGFLTFFTVPDVEAGPYTVNATDSFGESATADFTVQSIGLGVVNNVVGGPPDGPWNYLITETATGIVVANFTLSADGGTTVFPTLTGKEYVVNQTSEFNYYSTNVTLSAGANGTAYENYAIVYLPLNGSATVTFTNIATPPGPGYTFGSVDSVSPDFTFPFPANKIVPVQSAWPIDKNTSPDGKLDLVVNKTMAILVNVTDASIGTSTPVTVSITFDGAGYTDTTTTGSAKSRLIAIYPIVPRNLGDKTITGTYQVGASSPAALTSTVVTVRDTTVLKLFFAYFTPKTTGNYAVITPQSFADVAANITELINATYPFKQVIVNATYARAAVAGNATASSQAGAKNDMKYLANVAKLPVTGLGTDAIGVAIVPDSYFVYHGYPAGVVGAMVTPSVKAAVVSENWYAAGAHEVAHVLYSVFYAKEYYSTPALKGKVISGFWPQKGQWRTGRDIMDYACPPDGNWISSAYTYKYLFKNTTKTIADPEILFASGEFYQNGTVQLDSWYVVTEGTPDTVVPGNYALKFFDSGNNTLNVTDFDTSFKMEYIIGAVPGQSVIPSFDGVLESDSAPFAFSAVLPEGTAAVQVINNTDPSKPDVLATIPREDIPVVGPPAPATMNTYVTDSNFEPINSFNVLFKKTCPQLSTLTIAATDPATYYYTLDFKNNGPALTSVPVTVKIPTDFKLSGSQPVQIDFSPISYSFAGGLLTVNVQNVAIGETFTLRVHLDYKLKGTAGYPADSSTTYLANYFFDTTVNGASINAPSINAVGKKVTAIGGFVTDTHNSPQGGLRAKVYKGLTAKWSTIIDGDGYYSVGVAAGGPYSIVLYDSFGVPVRVKNGVYVTTGSYVPVDLTVLPTSCAVQGFVKDSLGNPISSVSVQLKGPLGKIQTTTTKTNTGGYYVFRFILPGTYTVKITVPTGYTAAVVSNTASVKLTRTATVNFVLAKK